MCRKLGIKPHLRQFGMHVLLVKADNEAEMVFENSRAFFKIFEHLKLASKLDEWKEKVSQGPV